MKQIKYYVLAGLAMMMLLIGCTEDNSMTEIQKENESKNWMRERAGRCNRDLRLVPVPLGPLDAVLRHERQPLPVGLAVLDPIELLGRQVF